VQQEDRFTVWITPAADGKPPPRHEHDLVHDAVPRW
jgi:hypothetical protein